MDHLTFVLPLTKEDLLSSSSTSQYHVSDVYSPNEIIRKLGDCRSALSHDGFSFISEHFDLLFSIVYNAKDLHAKYVHLAYDFISKGLEKLRVSLPLLLEEDSDSRKRLLNMTKMYLYLFSEFLRALEEKFNQNPEKEMAVDAKSRKKAAKAFTDFDWDELRGGALIHLYNFVQLPLQKLWDPPVADEDFVTLAANCCYKVLEDTQISQVRFKPLRDTINHILGTLVQRYNHGLSCTVKIVQLLKLYEHLAAPLAEAAVTFVQDYHSRNFIREVVRELKEAEMVFDAKACSQFLLEIAQIAPDMLLQCMPLLVPQLESDSYTLRNCVLGVMGEIISSSLSEEQLTNEQKETRDIFLEHLEDHLLDTNAYVRCKVLKIWQRLCQDKAIPLSRLSQLLDQFVPRLKDISWSVTRNAVQLYCALLQSNPFGDQIELAKLEQKLHDEEIVLAGMEKDLHRIIPPSHAKQWDEICPIIAVAIQDTLAALANDEAALDDVEQGESLTANIKLIARFLDSGEYVQAFKLLKVTEQMYPQSQQLKSNRELNWQVDYFLKLLQKIFIEFDETQDDGSRRIAQPELTKEQKGAQDQILKQRTLTQYLKDCVAFTKQLENATSVINNLLLSAQPSVIQDALEYLTSAYQFGLEGAMTGVRNMLLLVWSSESSVKEAVAVAYKKLYLEIAVNAPERSRAGEIVRNLSNLVKSLDEDQQTALEVLVREWIRNDEMERECIHIMWERFSLNLPGTTEEESRVALILLTMVGGAEIKIIKTNIDVLVSVGLGERGEKDYRLAKETCRAFLKLIPENVSVTSNEEPTRFESDHRIFEKLCSILKDGFLNLDDKYYTPFAYEAIDVIYQLSENPDVTCAMLLNHFVKLVKNNTPNSTFDDMMQESDANEKTESASQTAASSGVKIKVEILNRLVFFIGHIAFRQWIHLDRAVFRELKRRNRIREEQNEKRRGDREKKNNKDKRKSAVNLNSSILSRASETPLRRDRESSESPRKKEKDKEDAADAEIGELNADDGEAEFINQVCENEVLSQSSLLASLSPVVVAVCTNPQKYPDVQLRATASLALTKLMLVSSDVCEQHLPLVFTMMEKSVEPQIRSNLVYAVGDLANRFPNQLEPWSKHLYARLQDKSSRVRLDTIVVLKHLITNEMVKVRGQISDMALCIVDTEERISVMASQFFQDLSKKGNTLYNVMPDIISRLSNPEMKVPEEHFHTILEYLIPLIHRDKQMESLVDKLCQRFRHSTDDRQCRDIAFCLSLLQYSERSLRKLTENFACYADKLHSNEVHAAFETIINQALRAAKQEKKALAEELKAKIEESLRKGTGKTGSAENEDENEEDGEDRSEAQTSRPTRETNRRSKGASSKNGKKKGNVRNATRRRKKNDSSDDEEDDEDSDGDERRRHPLKAKRQGRR